MSTTTAHVPTNSIALLGMPFDANSSFMRGPAGAPDRIRAVMNNGAANLTAETGYALDGDGSSADWTDIGNVDCSDEAQALTNLEATVDNVLRQGGRTLTLGGDHSIAFPIIKAYARYYSNLTILQLDAHPDLYHNFEDNYYSHASPFARIIENGLVARLVQVGIRTINAHQREQADKYDVEVHEMRHWSAETALNLTGPLYISLDLDSLDPAFAPGVSHHEPGGFSTRELLNILQSINVPVVGADIVEYNPARDVNDVTAMVAGKLLKEVMALLKDSLPTEPL